MNKNTRKVKRSCIGSLKKIKRKNIKGITLVALVITIVIMLILTGVGIQAITNTGLFNKTKEAKQKSENAQVEENTTLADYTSKIDSYISTGRANGLNDDIKNYINQRLQEAEKIEITDLASDWKLAYNNSVKKGNMIYLDFALTKGSSWTKGWNNNIGKISINDETTHILLTLNSHEGQNTGEIKIEENNISIYELGTYLRNTNAIRINASYYFEN